MHKYSYLESSIYYIDTAKNNTKITIFLTRWSFLHFILASCDFSPVILDATCALDGSVKYAIEK